jgi:hypothetical protein
MQENDAYRNDGLEVRVCVCVSQSQDNLKCLTI